MNVLIVILHFYWLTYLVEQDYEIVCSSVERLIIRDENPRGYVHCVSAVRNPFGSALAQAATAGATHTGKHAPL